jgi:hypothetical protein
MRNAARKSGRSGLSPGGALKAPARRSFSGHFAAMRRGFLFI